MTETKKYNISADSPLRVNIGAGQTYIPGFVNVDISPKADVVLDIGRQPLPFSDDSVDLVFSYHTLEHVDNYLFALNEIYRVLRHGGRFLLGVPYVTLTEYNLVNPYHRQNFNEFSFYFFDPKLIKGSAAEENPIHFRKIYHHFHYMEGFRYLPGPIRNWCRRHLFNVVREIEFGLLAVKKFGDIGDSPVSEWREQFQSCLRERVAYGKD